MNKTTKDCFCDQGGAPLHCEVPEECLNCDIDIFERCHKVSTATSLQGISLDLSLITQNGLERSWLKSFNELTEKLEKDMKRIFWMILVATFVITSTALATSFSADTVMEMNGPTMGKMYYQDSKTFRSEGMGVISIVKGPLVYSIVTGTKKYVVMKLDDLRQENPMGAWVDATELIKSNKMKKIGKEKVQGYKCTIYEGDMQFAPQQPSMHMKIWYSDKLKNMLKQEATFPAPMGQIVTYLKNIKTGKQDSSLFEVPPGYTKVNDMAEAMGVGALGDFEMPSMGSDGGQIPSKEDMKKMMEQMQDMMKKTNQ